MDWTYFRHRVVYQALRLPMLLAARIKYNYSFTKAPELRSPYIVLANHTTFWDPFFVALAFPKHMYFLTSEHSFRMGFLSVLMKNLVDPVSRIKGSTDGAAALGMLRRLKKGRNICFFPEGERSFDGRTAAIHPTTAKLLRAAGVTVVTFRLRGGYLSDPRWAKTKRRGRVTGSVVHVYRPEELRAMSAAQIAEAVNEDIYEDAWLTQSRWMQPYRGKRLAEGLEEALFTCPGCGAVGSLRGQGDTFYCACGVRAEMDETGFFKPGAPFHSVGEWDDWQKSAVKKRCEAGGVIYSDPGADLFSLDEGHVLRRIDSGVITLTGTRLSVGESAFGLSAMNAPATCRGSRSETVMFTSGGRHYEIALENSASRRKYVLAIESLRDVMDN